MTKVTNLNHTAARTFFLKEKSYSTIQLPGYFTFQNLLNRVSDELANRPINDLYNEKRPIEFANVNFHLLMSEDGEYEWYPLSLIHPALYVALVNIITEDVNWNTIVDQLNRNAYLSDVTSYSIPSDSDENTFSEKHFLISNAQFNFEQRSEELMLEYKYVLHTDIPDCHGNLFTRSIPWALHGRESVVNKDEHIEPFVPLLGNAIESLIKDMRYGHTKRNPQGSVLMDLFVELVLGYVEANTAVMLKSTTINDYKIIRYRDHYTIFANDLGHAEMIGDYLLVCLSEIGLGLHEFRTYSTDSGLKESVKADYLDWLKYNVMGQNLLESYYYLLIFTKKQPYSSVFATVLKEFYYRIDNEEIKRNDISALISEATRIGYVNPKTYPFIAAIISNLVHREEYYRERNRLINTTKKKFNKRPNAGLMELWVQRMSIPINRKKKYEETLCQKVYNPDLALWNCDWLDEKMRCIIEKTPIIDEEVIERLSLVIGMEELETLANL